MPKTLILYEAHNEKKTKMQRGQETRLDNENRIMQVIYGDYKSIPSQNNQTKVCRPRQLNQ